ncbi:MAG: hypothetical protein C0465_08755 [Ralstonia sp.]|nr:hypothetical protein [Ralstonia sp.]MBA4230693.1 hypothetical protein [Ralstonia sp.]MBA4237669.1 hypothetical protein [Ralstonia sp.]MBA4402435.1 hypothetical protein [Ralstonia sp.]POH87633.1 hypothetical protein CJ026_012435 [Ralstonia pickettii]
MAIVICCSSTGMLQKLTGVGRSIRLTIQASLRKPPNVLLRSMMWHYAVGRDVIFSAIRLIIGDELRTIVVVRQLSVGI